MPLPLKKDKMIYKRLEQGALTANMLSKLEIVLENSPDENQKKCLKYEMYPCDDSCHTKSSWTFKELEDMNININSKEDFRRFQLNHYKTCTKLKKQIEDPYSFHGKVWRKLSLKKIDLTLDERSCNDCGKVFATKNLRKQHTKHYKYKGKEDLEFGKGCKYNYFNLVSIDCYNCMIDDIDTITGLGTLEESIKLFITPADKRKLTTYRKKYMIAYEYDILRGSKTIITRHIISLFDSRRSGHNKTQYKILPIDFQDADQSDTICNWTISSTENERLSDGGAFYMDGCWQFEND